MVIDTFASDWLDIIAVSRSGKTFETYRNAYRSFRRMLIAGGIKPSSAGVKQLTERHIGDFAKYLKGKSAATEKVYLTAVKRFYRHLNAEEVTMFNMDRVTEIIQTRVRKPKVRIPEFPEKEIALLLDRVSTLPLSTNKAIRLRQLRDTALILTLADTGLRIFEACSLKRADLNFDKKHTIIIGKGDKQGRIRFSRRAKLAIEKYLRERQPLDGAQGVEIQSLPVFSRHDRGVGKRIAPFSTVTGANIIRSRVNELLDELPAIAITPHKFRHYFVSLLLRETDNLKIAQEWARHESISTTQRYAHPGREDLDRAYDRAIEGDDR